MAENEEIEFPDQLCEKIAEITDKFSFAYMQEAFVATLVSIAAREGQDVEKWAGPEDELVGLKIEDGKDGDDDDDDDLKDLLLWKEIKKQIQILRDEMDEKTDL